VVLTVTKTEIQETLEGEYSHPAFDYFCDEMKSRLYGYEALRFAWLWFQAGWDARVVEGL
jgi:hypothetical protein